MLDARKWLLALVLLVVAANNARSETVSIAGSQPLKGLLTTLVKATGLDISISPRIRSEVHINLCDFDALEALELVVCFNRLQIVRDGDRGRYVIMPLPESDEGRRSVQTTSGSSQIDQSSTTEAER